MVAANPPDLILMDLNLPVMDGWEATKRLKADTRTAKIPVIALTAHARCQNTVSALWRRAATTSDTKPIDFDQAHIAKMRTLPAV